MRSDFLQDVPIEPAVHHQRDNAFGSVDNDVSDDEAVIGEVLLAAIHSGFGQVERVHEGLSG